jgi:putative transposase
MDWARILAFVTGTVDQELLARIEYLTAENRILKAQLKGRMKLSDAERARLGEIGHRLGRKFLGEVATVARPDTILAWYRKLVARKFNGSKARRRRGRPRIRRAVEQLIIRMARENRDWGYDRIVGALANLGYKVCDQTVGNVLRRHGLPPAPERKRTTTWSAFIRIHLALLVGTDFFTAEPCRAESPREGQCPTVPSECKHPPRRAYSMPRATGRPVALLLSGGSVTACSANEHTD